MAVLGSRRPRESRTERQLLQVTAGASRPRRAVGFQRPKQPMVCPLSKCVAGSNPTRAQSAWAENPSYTPFLGEGLSKTYSTVLSIAKSFSDATDRTVAKAKNRTLILTNICVNFCIRITAYDQNSAFGTGAVEQRRECHLKMGGDGSRNETPRNDVGYC